MRKLMVFFALLPLLPIMPSPSAGDVYCYKCPANYGLSVAEDNNYYCLAGAGATPAKPVWAKPKRAAVVWAIPSPGRDCPSRYFPYPDRKTCGKCPTSYTWLSAYGEPEACGVCDPGFLLTV
jgi:hypothetical protein